MNTIRYLLYVSTSLTLFYFSYATDQSNEPNSFYYERAEMKVMPNSGFKTEKFLIKKLNFTVMDIDVQVSLNRTYQSMFVHIVAYRQFSSNEYRKFLVDKWEDLCKVADGGNGNIVLNIIKGKLSKYTNIFRHCPYTPGNYYITMKRMPMDWINFGHILPSGRYRVEFSFAKDFQGTILLLGKVFISVSDRRVEQF